MISIDIFLFYLCLRAEPVLWTRFRNLRQVERSDMWHYSMIFMRWLARLYIHFLLDNIVKCVYCFQRPFLYFRSCRSIVRISDTKKVRYILYIFGLISPQFQSIYANLPNGISRMKNQRIFFLGAEGSKIYIMLVYKSIDKLFSQAVYMILCSCYFQLKNARLTIQIRT